MSQGPEKKPLERQRESLSPNTWVPLGAVVGVILSLVGGTWYLSRSWAELEIRLIRLDTRLNTIEGSVFRIETSVDDRWRGRDMSLWVERLQELNPEIKVPRVPDKQ